MQMRKQKQLFHIPIEYANGMWKTVKIRATSREVAERRALKFNPKAIGIKREN